MNTRFIRRVARQILKEPQYYAQDILIEATVEQGEGIPGSQLWKKRKECGTAACIAGTAIAIDGTWLTDQVSNTPNITNRAAALMGLSLEFINNTRLFGYTGSAWPDPYDEAWMNANGQEEHAQVAHDLLMAIADGKLERYEMKNPDTGYATYAVEQLFSNPRRDHKSIAKEIAAGTIGIMPLDRLILRSEIESAMNLAVRRYIKWQEINQEKANRIKRKETNGQTVSR